MNEWLDLDRIGCVVFFFFKQKTAYEILTCDWSSDVCSSDLTIIATGDLNENLNNDETHHLHNILSEHGYLQLIQKPTCITGSLLDVVYVKGDVERLKADVEPIYFSDHEMVSVKITQ